MGKSIIVGSMNIQNKYRISNYDGIDPSGQDNALILREFLDEYKIDILGTQELVRKFIRRLNVVFKPKYKMYGSFRYGNTIFVKKINFVDRFNETASIITKHKVIKSRTYRLPWLPYRIKDTIDGIKRKSLRPRVVTSCIVDITGWGRINFINTQLEHRINIIQIRQLNYLYKMISKSKYPTILTGDFNMDMNMPRFKNFVSNLESIGYKRVPNNEVTWKYQEDKLPIDHIFIPNSWKIEKVDIIKSKDLRYFSDHYPILVKITK